MISQYKLRKETSAAVVAPGAVRSIKPRTIPVIPWSQKSHQMLVRCGCEATIMTSSPGTSGDTTGWGRGGEGGMDSGDARRSCGNGSAAPAFSPPAAPASTIVSDPFTSLTCGAKSFTHGVNLYPRPGTV